MRWKAFNSFKPDSLVVAGGAFALVINLSIPSSRIPALFCPTSIIAYLTFNSFKPDSIYMTLHQVGQI